MAGLGSLVGSRRTGVQLEGWKEWTEARQPALRTISDATKSCWKAEEREEAAGVVAAAGGVAATREATASLRRVARRAISGGADNRRWVRRR